MSDWNDPTLASEYSDFRDIIKEQLENLGLMDFTGDTNIPVGFIRLGSGDKAERYTGSSWTITARESEIDSHLNNTSLHSGSPIGCIEAWLTPTAPTNYKICDGSAISRTTYAALFSLLGTTYGTGDGSTTFNLPDIRGWILCGKGGSGSSSAALGTKFGFIDHGHTAPSHTHTIASHSHDMGNHSHTGGAHTHSTPDHTHTVPAHYHGVDTNGADIRIVSSGAHSHGIPTRANATGFSNSEHGFGTVSPSWAGAYGENTQTAGAHVHANTDFDGFVGNLNSTVNGDGSFSTPSGGGSTTGSGGSVATGNPSTNTTSAASLTTDAGGAASTSFNNPPCMLVNWIIKVS